LWSEVEGRIASRQPVGLQVGYGTGKLREGDIGDNSFMQGVAVPARKHQRIAGLSSDSEDPSDVIATSHSRGVEDPKHADQLSDSSPDPAKKPPRPMGPKQLAARTAVQPDEVVASEEDYNTLGDIELNRLMLRRLDDISNSLAPVRRCSSGGRRGCTCRRGKAGAFPFLPDAVCSKAGSLIHVLTPAVASHNCPF